MKVSRGVCAEDLVNNGWDLFVNNWRRAKSEDQQFEFILVAPAGFEAEKNQRRRKYEIKTATVSERS